MSPAAAYYRKEFFPSPPAAHPLGSHPPIYPLFPHADYNCFSPAYSPSRPCAHHNMPYKSPDRDPPPVSGIDLLYTHTAPRNIQTAPPPVVTYMHTVT